MEDEACVVNIGPAQRRLRFRVGVAGFLVGLVLLVVLLWFDAPRITRVACAAPFLVGATGVLQAHGRT